MGSVPVRRVQLDTHFGHIWRGNALSVSLSLFLLRLFPPPPPPPPPLPPFSSHLAGFFFVPPPSFLLVVEDALGMLWRCAGDGVGMLERVEERD